MDCPFFALTRFSTIFFLLFSIDDNRLVKVNHFLISQTEKTECWLLSMEFMYENCQIIFHRFSSSILCVRFSRFPIIFIFLSLVHLSCLPAFMYRRHEHICIWNVSKQYECIADIVSSAMFSWWPHFFFFIIFVYLIASFSSANFRLLSFSWVFVTSAASEEKNANSLLLSNHSRTYRK